MIKGRARIIGDDVSGDQILPGKHLAKGLPPEELVKYLFESVRPDLATTLLPGDIIVAGENFGGGSTRELGPRTLKQAGIPCVIARSFGRAFYRNGVNLGILPVECTFEVLEMDMLEVDPEEGTIKVNGGAAYQFQKYPPLILDMIREGGLLNYYLNHGTL